MYMRFMIYIEPRISFMYNYKNKNHILLANIIVQQLLFPDYRVHLYHIWQTSTDFGTSIKSRFDS